MYDDITCAVCDKHGKRSQLVGNTGWTLAKNLMFYYTCSKPCEDELAIYLESKKKKKK